MLDVEALLAETAEAPPCGPNLEYDLAFFELQDAARGKPAQEFGTGDERQFGKSAEEPRWPEVVDLAQGLLSRSKDVRIAVHLTRGLTRTEATSGLCSGLQLVHGLLDRFWDHVHPVLDAEADNDPTERLNALAPLADPEALLRDVRDTYLVNSRQHGQLQVREVEIAFGRLAPVGAAAGAPGKSLSQIHGQLRAAFADDRTVPSALDEAHTTVRAIERLIAERVGADRGIDLKPLAQCLGCLLEACETALGTDGGRDEAEDRRGADTGLTPRGAVAGSAGGEIGSREEALRVLDLVCRYLERNEPSNPAPLFIRRAQRLMTKSFVDIVKDLMPDSLAQLEHLAGGLEET
jgi:type VI secretion system protein ImpA